MNDMLFTLVRIEYVIYSIMLFASSGLKIGLITVFGAILTGRQSSKKLQCLCGNSMANNFFYNGILRNL